MNSKRWTGLPIAVALGLCPVPSAAQEIPTEDRAALRAQAESLGAEVLPEVARLVGFSTYRPVRIEVTTKAELQESLMPSLRAMYGTDGLRRSGRVLAELGFWPRDFDLETELAALLIELMGGGYDPQRRTFYVLLDLPPQLKEPSMRRMVAAHELTHALEDQAGNMADHLRRGIADSDYSHLYNGIAEGIAYLTMMAVLQGVPVAQAPDPSAMLRSTYENMERNSSFPLFGRSPRYLREMLFGTALDGVGFCRAWLKDHPEGKLVSLLDSLPASGEQVLHYDKYREGDRPTRIDLTGLGPSLPAAWRLYDENTLGEAAIRTLCQTHEVTRESAGQIAAGWDGCRFAAFEDGDGKLSVLGLSAWDRPEDAQEFQDGLLRLLADCRDEADYAVQVDGSRVSFVVGVGDPEARLLASNALGGVPISP